MMKNTYEYLRSLEERHHRAPPRRAQAMMVSVILAFLVTMLLRLDEWKSFEGGFWGYQRSLYKQSQIIFQSNTDSSVRRGQEGKEVAITTSNCSDKLSSPTSTSSATNVVLDWSVLEKEKGDGPRVNLCRIPSYNMATEDPAGESFPFHVAYQCAGEEYDRFGEQLQRLVKVYSLSDAVRKEAWGQKPVPLPANTSVLAFGNSHTKQMISAWICQYFDQVTSYQAIRSDRAFSVRFENNSTLTLLRHSDLDGATALNNPWLGRPMTSFDAVIVGQLNPEKNGLPMGSSTFDYNNKKKKKKEWSPFPQADGDSTNLYNVAAAFPGPIVFSSNFGKHDMERAISLQEGLERLSKDRKNMVSLMARRYIDIVGNEAGTDKPHEVGECLPMAPRSHRCMGDKGGWPDVQAFDVQSAIWKLLEETKNR